MRPAHALLLSLAAAAAITGAEAGGHHGEGRHHGGMGHHRGGMRPRGEETGEKPCGHGHGEDGGLMSYLNDGFQRSNEMIQRFFGFGDPQEAAQEGTPAIRVVILEEGGQTTGLDANERQMACLKALELMHERDEMAQEAETLMGYFRTAFQSVTLHMWDKASCDDLGRQALADECNRVLSSEMAVREYLQSGQTDKEVCAIMAATSEDESSLMTHDEELMPIEDLGAVGNDTLSCKLCQRLVQMVDQALEQEVQQVEQVRAIIGDLCDAMAKDSMCHTFLNNFDAIVAWLKHGTDPMVVCTRITMCTPEDSALPGEETEADDSEEEETSYWAVKSPGHHGMMARMHDAEHQKCFFCSHVASVVYKVNNEAPNQLPMLKTALSSLCQFASPDASCEEVEKNFEQIVELANHGQRPHELCGTLELCNMKPKVPFDELDSTQPCELGRHGEGDSTCEYCDAATTVLEIVMQEDPDQVDQVREYADMICSMLGDDSPCHEYVNQLDTVIDALQKGTHPRDICKALKYCTAEREDHPPFDNGEARVGMMRPGHHGHHNQLGMMGPGKHRGHHGHRQGRGMMERGGRHGHHEESGMMRGMEHPPHPHPHPHPHPPHNNSCFFCSRVAMVIHHVSRATPDKLPVLKTILSNLCQLVPSGCKCDMLDKNFDKMVALEKEGKCPFQVCKSVGACNKTLDRKEGPPAMEHALKGVVLASQWTPVGNNTQCTYCQFATTVAKIALQQYGADIRQVRTYADMICDMLGEDNPCHVYVKEMDFVIDSITKGMSSKAICTSLKFCSAEMLSEQMTIADTNDEESSLVLRHAPYSRPHPPHDPSCFFCTHVAVAIHVVNKTEPAKLPVVKTILSNVCQLTPSKFKCDEVNASFDKIVEMEKTGEHPHKICKSLGLCHKKPCDIDDELPLVETMSAVVAATRPDLGDKKTCFLCDYATSLLQAGLEEDAAKVEQARQLADSACALMGEPSGCHEYVEKLDFVLDSLKNGTHPHAICVSMKYCAAKDDMLALASPLETTDLALFDPALVEAVQQAMAVDVDACFFCTQVAAIVEVAVAEDPTKIAQIRQIADVICGMLPTDNQCHAFVKQFDTVVDSLQKGEQPKAICHDLKYCPTDVNPALAKLAAPSSEEVATQSSLEGNNSCAYCSGVVTVLKFALAQKPEQVKELREAAGIACQLMPEDDTCHEDLKMFDEAVTDLQAGKEPHAICQTLKFCTAAEMPSSLLSVGVLDFAGADFVAPQCANCQQNPLLLASLITRPDSVATFKKELDSICRLAPKSSECEMLLKHEAAIIDSLEKDEDVEAICTRIEECEPVSKEAAVEKSMSVGCLFCEYTAELLMHADHNEKLLRRAKVTLETMCTILPPCARCDVLSSKFDEIVALVQAGKSPRESCHAVELCDAASVSMGKVIREEDVSTGDAATADGLDQVQQAVGNVMEIQ